ncbi:hypothetical protein G6F22_021912 [Rhizopus arrhizus]|nr:hypothetical protein G6F22_021912 [Rhizopus arrhizus]
MSAYIFSPSFCDAVDRASTLASIAALSPSFSVSSRSLMAASMLSFSEASSLSPYSVNDLRVACTSASAWLRDWASSATR